MSKEPGALHAEFSEFVWPLVSDADNQVHLRTLRAGRRFRPGVLGPDAKERIAALPQELRKHVISEIASHGDMDGIELATSLAKADASPEVRKSTIESLVFRRADRFANDILASSPDEVWRSLALKWHSREFSDPEVSARIQEEADKCIVEESDPVRVLNTILGTNVHDQDAKQKVRELVERTDFSDQNQEQDNRWVIQHAYELYPEEVGAGLLALLVQGKKVPFQAEEMLRISTVVIDDGPLTDCVLKHTGDGRDAAIAASVVGPKTVGGLIDQMFVVYARIKANDRHDESLSNEYHKLMGLISGSKVDPFAEAILERSHAEDPHQIYMLAELISRHGGSVERERLSLAPEPHERITAAVQRWAEILLISSEASRAQFAEIAQAAERLESPELVPVLLKLLPEDLKRRKCAQEEWLDARKQGRQIQNDAHTIWTLQYQRAFAAIGDQQTVDAMRIYLRDPEFGFEAAHVLKAIWRESQPPQDKTGFLRSWPDFSVVPEAYRKRQSGTVEETHPFVNDMIAAIKELIKPDVGENNLICALKLATVAFSMPYADQAETIDALLQLPVPATAKRDLLTVLALSGEAISSEFVLRGIDDLLEEAKSKAWVIQEQEGWRLEGWLRLLPFTESPSAVLHVLDRAEGFRAEPRNLRSLLAALGCSPLAEAETVLGELAKRDDRFLSEYDWLAALTNRNTLSAARFFLDLVCNISFTERRGNLDHSHISKKMAALITSDDQFRQDVYKRFSSLDAGPARFVIEHAIAEAADAEGVLLLTRQGAARNKSFKSAALSMALHNALVGQTPMESPGMQQLYSLPAPELRKGLFDMVTNGSAAETRLATECLCAIDENRDVYGHVVSEPRHPNITAGVPWPKLDAE